MNWVLIIVLSILAASTIFGYYKGVLRIAYSLVAWVIVLAFVAWATPHINLYLLESTSIYEKVEVHCEEVVRRSANKQVETAQSENEEKSTERLEIETQLAEMGMSVPDSVIEGILEKTTDATEAILEESGVYTKLAEGMANFVVEGISFLIALVSAWILVHLISQLIGIASHIPIIKGVNRFLGLFAGAIYGLLLVWLGFYITVLASTGEMGKVIVSYIYESPFLTFLYENNLVLTLILKYF